MIAATRRMAIHDFLLIAFSVAVIVLWISPKGDARQTLVVRHHSGILQRYSFEADDPRLAKLRRDLVIWSRGVPGASLALEKWRAEIADHYANRTDRKAKAEEGVMRVSFAGDHSSAVGIGAAKQLSAQHAYWISVGDDARTAIAESESRLEQQRMLAGPPPITIGKVIRGSHSPRRFVWASLMGLLVASGFALWTYICPAIRLRVDVSAPQLETPELDDTGRFHELRLAIPAKWVRVHQPIPIVIRQIAYTAVVAGGLACAIL